MPGGRRAAWTSDCLTPCKTLVRSWGLCTQRNGEDHGPRRSETNEPALSSKHALIRGVLRSAAEQKRACAEALDTP